VDSVDAVHLADIVRSVTVRSADAVRSVTVRSVAAHSDVVRLDVVRLDAACLQVEEERSVIAIVTERSDEDDMSEVVFTGADVIDADAFIADVGTTSV